MTLIEMLEKSAQDHRRRTCIIFKKKKITYGELNDLTNNLAGGLINRGIKKGERVAILLGNSPEYIIGYLGILKTGATVVPLNNMLKADELTFILKDSGAAAIIVSTQFLAMARELKLRVEGLKDIITIGESWQDTVSFDQMVASRKETRIAVSCDPEEIAAILYTSGTTGKPKGAMLTHNNLISNVTSSVVTIHATRKDNFLCVLPMFHSFTFTVCILMPIYLGARITIVESVKPFGRVIKNIFRHRATIFVGVPPIYNALSNISVPKVMSWWPFSLLNPLRVCISGAAPLPVEVLKNFEAKFRIPLLEGYGLTESSPVVSIIPLDGVHKPGSIGLPIPEVEVKVADDSGKELARGEVGELLVKGPNVMKGYLNLPQATEEAIKDGWLHTGDMARIDEDNYIYIVDRKKDMVLVRGMNVYPREVEEVLYQHPKVAEAAVVGIRDEARGEVPKAYLALKEGQKASESEIIRFCRERLANYKVPRQIEFRDSLPKTPTGKVLKRGLR